LWLSNNKKIHISFIGTFCISFCLGIVLAAFSKLSLSAFYFCAFLSFFSAALFLNRDFRSSIFISIFALFFGACLFRNSQTLPNYHIYRFTPYKGAEVSLRGVIISDPQTRNKRTTFVFKAKEIISHKINKVCGNAQVVAFRGNKFSYGQELLLRGKLYRPMNFGSGKRFSYRDYLKQQGIYSLFSAKNIKYLRDSQASPIQGFAFWLKHKTQEIMRRHISGVPVAVLEAMILGERRDIPAYLNTAMMHTGTIHILVVSGFNVGIVAFIALLFLKIMRIPRKPRYSITILLLIIYCLMTGASVPVVRATIMGIAILLGKLLKREANIYNSLSLSALIILIFNPEQLFNIGFQLSFASVLAIICFYPKLYALFPLSLRKIKSINWIIQAFSVSLSAWLGTIGLIAYYFNIFSNIGIFANMIIAPYASLITTCGLSLVFISIIIPPLAIFFAATAELLALILIKMNLFFANLPHAYFKIPALNFIYAFSYYLSLILIVFLYRQWYNNPSK